MKRDPVYRVIASDRDDGPNAEISYSIEEGDEHGKFFIEPKTGLVSSKKFSSAGEYDILTVSIQSQAFIVAFKFILYFVFFVATYLSYPCTFPSVFVFFLVS